MLESIRLAPPVFETMMTLPKPMVMRNFAGSGQDRYEPRATSDRGTRKEFTR